MSELLQEERLPYSLRGRRISTEFFRESAADYGPALGSVNRRMVAVAKRDGTMTIRREFANTGMEPMGSIMPGFIRDMFADEADRGLSLSEAMDRLQAFEAREDKGHGSDFIFPETDIPVKEAAKIIAALKV
jgi:hypothetical protein